MQSHYRLFNTMVTAGLALLLSILIPVADSTAQQDSPQTLKEQLDATSKRFANQMPSEVIQNIEAAVQEIAGAGIVDSALKEGDRAPGFELPDATGTKVNLAALLKQGPVVLTWYRGNW